MTGVPSSACALADELRAVLGSLDHARRRLGQERIGETDELSRRLAACAHHIAGLECDECTRLKPLMLALMDELQLTIGAFDAEHRTIAEKLRAAHRNMAAGVAYQQAKAR